MMRCLDDIIGIDGCEFEQSQGDGEEQGSLECSDKSTPNLADWHESGKSLSCVHFATP